MDVKQLIYTLCTGGYIFEMVFLGILLCTDIFEAQQSRKTPFRKICSFVLFFDALATVFAIAMSLSGIWYEQRGMSRTIDGFVYCLLFIAGDTLLHNRYPSWKKCLAYMSPYLFILVIQFIDKAGHPTASGYAIAVVTILLFLRMSFAADRHDRRLKDGYSNFEGHTTKWYIVITVLLICDMIFWFLPELSGITSYWLGIIYSLIMSIIWVLFASFAVKQKEPIINHIHEPEDSSEFKAEAPSTIAVDLLRLMENEEVYLNSELTIESIAKTLNTNCTYVSKCFHSELHTSFYEFVNGKRVEYAKRLLTETDKKIESVALLSGFNSSRAFLRVFKQVSGETPTEWRRNHHNG